MAAMTSLHAENCCDLVREHCRLSGTYVSFWSMLHWCHVLCSLHCTL